RCSGCHTAYYYSREHIVEDWQRHKAECQAVSSAKIGPAPSRRLSSDTEEADAILFAIDEEKPRMIKVQVHTMPGDEYEPWAWKKLERKPWFSERSCVRSLLVGTQWANGPTLSHGMFLCIRYDEEFFINGSKPNKYIQRFTNGQAFHPWAGNFYVVRTDSTQEHKYFSASIVEDLPALKNYFIQYGK
ncbi:hypothetical protein GYMLUDRAFT_181189, partial [Collybiopsis luxurians FD-317 M1]